MPGDAVSHPPEEILERYALGRLADPELASFEDHLLLCAHCQQRLDEATDYVGTMRQAAQNLLAEHPLHSEPEPAFWRRWFQWGWLPAPAWAGAMAVLLAVLAIGPWRGATPVAPAEWRTVELETLRGPENQASALPGYALDLRLDITGLAPEPMEAQIVAAGGTIIYTNSVSFLHQKAVFRYSLGLKNGQYWVRLKRNGETIREYSLQVRDSGKPL